VLLKERELLKSSLIFTLISCLTELGKNYWNEKTEFYSSIYCDYLLFSIWILGLAAFQMIWV